jgi:hypothetical protein
MRDVIPFLAVFLLPLGLPCVASAELSEVSTAAPARHSDLLSDIGPCIVVAAVLAVTPADRSSP